MHYIKSLESFLKRIAVETLILSATNCQAIFNGSANEQEKGYETRNYYLIPYIA